MSRRPTASLALYGALTSWLAPLAPALLAARARRGKEDPQRLGERLGRPGRPRPDGPLVWFHGVSVGETAALLPLVAAIGERRPDLGLLITSGTRTAAAMLGRRQPPGALHQYAPIDTPGAVGRFLDHWRPALAVFTESEIWPNLIRQAQARGVRLALVSARMAADSARAWGRLPRTAQALLGAFELVLPQDAATAERLQALGARPGPRLNLKLVGEPLPHDAAELARMRASLAGRKVVLAASTHPGEEALILRAFRDAVPDPAEALLVIAPRHPERGPALAAELDAPRRSAGALLAPDAAVYLADTLGELGLFFRLADVVVMGGSFVPGVGGHNPLEPARLCRPVVSGPHVANAAELYAELRLRVAALIAADEAALARHLRGLLDYPHVARRTAEAALAYAQRSAEALDRALAALEPLLPPP